MAWAVSWTPGISEAYAHGLDEPAYATDAFFDGDRLVAVPTNFGLLARVGDGWRWTPEETVRGALRTAAFHDGEVLVGTTEGLFSTSDGGCSWTSDAELRGLTVLDIEVDGDDVWVGTESATRPSGLFRSEQGGPFEPTALYSEDTRVTGVGVAGEVVWASVFEGADSSWHVRVRERADSSFDTLPLEGGSLRLLAATQTEAVVAAKTDGWAAVRLGLDQVVAERSVDAEPIAATLGEPAWIVTAEGRLLNADTGDVLDSDAHCVRSDGWYCTSTDGRDTALRHVDGGRRLTWADVGPADCPAGTDGGRFVGELWPTANAAGIGPRDAPEGAGTVDQGCCRVVGDRRSGGLWFVLLLALFRRRS